MGKALKELDKYIRNSLNSGFSFEKIQGALIKKGYSKQASKGILLRYKHRVNVIKWLTVGSLAIVLILSLFLGGTGIVGMVTVEYSSNYIDELNLVINESSAYSWYPPNQGELLGVFASANFVGEGSANVYIENQGVRFKIFDTGATGIGVTEIDSSIIDNKVRHFEQLCEETCLLNDFSSSIYNLEFEVEDGVLEIEKLFYEIGATKDFQGVPQFADIDSSEIGLESRLKIDLNSFFNSSDKATFSYVALDNIIDISIENDIAIINPIELGEAYVYFIANVNGVEFISNLIEISVTEAASNEEILIKGFQNEGLDDIILEEETSIGTVYLLTVIFLGLLGIIALLLLRRNEFDLSKNLDKIRSSKLTHSLVNYREFKNKAIKGGMSREDKAKAIDSVHKELKKISDQVPRSKLKKEFKNKSRDFEEATSLNLKHELYIKLRKLYLKIIEGKLSQKEKKSIFKKMDKYYKEIKK